MSRRPRLRRSRRTDSSDLLCIDCPPLLRAFCSIVNVEMNTGGARINKEFWERNSQPFWQSRRHESLLIRKR